MTYPIPTHLKDIFVTDEETSNLNSIEGAIKCTCGCEKFYLKNFAEYNDDCPCVAKKGNGFAFVIQAVCADCGREWVVMDLSKHGYDGLVCKEGLAVDNSELKRYSCPKCGEEKFDVKVGIEVEDKEQFIEECVAEFPDEFSPEDYVDAFDWITISIKCCNCDMTNDEWVSLELS